MKNNKIVENNIKALEKINKTFIIMFIQLFREI